MLSDDVRRALIELDASAIRKFWHVVAPGAPQPRTDAEAVTTMHCARTLSMSIPDHLRYYSHRWLLDRGLPSGLPEALKPAAERMYPRIAEGVGLAALVPRPYTPVLRRVAEEAVLDMYASSRKPEPDKVRARIAEVRAAERKKLGV